MHEMLTIARAIRVRQRSIFGRCAVAFWSDGVHFWSPRNSSEDGVVSISVLEFFNFVSRIKAIERELEDCFTIMEVKE